VWFFDSEYIRRYVGGFALMVKMPRALVRGCPVCDGGTVEVLEYDCEEEIEYEPWCPYEYYGPQRQRSVRGLKGENEFEREAWCPYKD
jgi:hypothetical protein